MASKDVNLISLSLAPNGVSTLSYVERVKCSEGRSSIAYCNCVHTPDVVPVYFSERLNRAAHPYNAGRG
jgi:hypothetical protein